MSLAGQTVAETTAPVASEAHQVQTVPAGATVDIEKIKAELSASIEDRIKGFQRLVSERDRELEKAREELEGYRTAGLSEDEREQRQQNQLQQQLEQARMEVEMLKLGHEFPDEMPIIQRFFAAETLRDQAAILRELRSSTANAVTEAAATVADTDVEVPSVDANNPMRAPYSDVIRLSNGQTMTEAEADRLLGATSRMR